MKRWSLDARIERQSGHSLLMEVWIRGRTELVGLLWVATSVR